MLNDSEKIYLKKIGDNVRKLRLKSMLTQSQVAFELGTSTKQYQRIEYGEINSGIITFYRLAKIFNTSLFEVLK